MDLEMFKTAEMTFKVTLRSLVMSLLDRPHTTSC